MQAASSDTTAAMKGQRPVYLHSAGNFVTIDIYDGDLLGPEAQIQGPAVVELQTTAVVVPHRFALSCDQMGNFVLMRSEW